MMAVMVSVKSEMNQAGLTPQGCSGRSLMNAKS
jgi:hypothetical protein